MQSRTTLVMVIQVGNQILNNGKWELLHHLMPMLMELITKKAVILPVLALGVKTLSMLIAMIAGNTPSISKMPILLEIGATFKPNSPLTIKEVFI